MVAQLKVFDDGQRRIGFTQTHAVGQDAAVVGVDFLNGPFDTIFLEFKQGFPNLSVRDGGIVKELGLLFLAREKFFKNVEQGLEVNELRGMVHIELSQVLQHLGFDIFNEGGV